MKEGKNVKIIKNGCTFYIGEGVEILPIYRAMRKAWAKSVTWLTPVYADIPKLIDYKLYALCIDVDESLL